MNAAEQASIARINALRIFREWLLPVHYKDWSLLITCDTLRNNGLYLQWSFPAICAKTLMVVEQQSRKWHVSEHCSRSELIQTAFKAALTAEEHECRESFHYHGRPIFGPHMYVGDLFNICQNEDVRK